MSDDRDGTKIADRLNQRLRGVVAADERTLSRYSVDQSIYQIQPLLVAFPEDIDDVIEITRFASEEGLPLTARAGGTSTAGSALGRGILMVFARGGPLNRIVSLEERAGEQIIAVEPGVLHADMQHYLRQQGRYVPADPSSANICLLGGNIATKASGPHALKHGSIDRYLHSLQFVTTRGELVDTSDAASIPDYLQQGVARVQRALLADETSTRRLQSRIHRKLASGYNLFTFLRDSSPADWIAQLLVGSVGTLGIITGAQLRTEPYEEGRSTSLLYFRHLREAGDAVQHIKALNVAAIEIMNYRSLRIVAERYPDTPVPAGEAHTLLVEYEGPERHDQAASVERIVAEHAYAMAEPPRTMEGEEEQEDLWKARKALLPAVRSYRPNLKAPSLVNDVGLEPAYLADFIEDVEAIFDHHGVVAAIYGHAGSGNLHLRPLFDVGAHDLQERMTRLTDDVYAALFKYDGTITAEHGMGRVRAPYLVQEWGDVMVDYMRQIKDVFDPDGLLNPEVMFSARTLMDDVKPSLV
jgi:glycolate oxidase